MPSFDAAGRREQTLCELLADYTKNKWAIVSSEPSSHTLTIDYLKPELFEAHSVACCLLIEFSE
jgi:hypothetical protein